MSELLKDNTSHYELKPFKSQELFKNEHETSNMQLAVRDSSDLQFAGSKIEENISALSNESQLEISQAFLHFPDYFISLEHLNTKKSCHLTGIYSTCINKAINHLESLQNAIDKWLLKVGEEGGEDALRSESSRRLMQVINKNARNIEGLSNESSRAHSKLDQSLMEVLSESSLSTIESDLAEKAISLHNKFPIQERLPLVSQMRYTGLLKELFYLIARLEFDRRRTEAMLSKEKANLNVLKTKIESIALKRVSDLPRIVQREHDACVSDITELNWHLTFNQKAERKLLHKVKMDEDLYNTLKNEIENTRKNIPLIDEKMHREIEISEKIRKAQEEVNQQLKKAQHLLNETKEKLKLSQQRAGKEREAIKDELNICNRELRKALKRLEDAENVRKEQLELLETYVKKLEQNQIAERAEVTKKYELRKKIEKLEDEIRELKNKRYEVHKEIERIRNENAQKQENIDGLKQKFKEELEKLFDAMNKKIEKLEKILKKKHEKEVDLEEMAKDKAKLLKKLEKDGQNRERLLNDKARAEEELKNTLIAHSNVLNVWAKSKAEHETEMKVLEQREELLRRQINDLKKQMGEERQSTNQIISKMSAENVEYKLARKSEEEKRALFLKRKAEMEQRLRDFNLMIKQLTERKRVLEEELKVLREKLKSQLDLMAKRELELNERIKQCEPVHESNKEQQNMNEERLNHMKSHSTEMNNKIEEMKLSKQIMFKNIQKTKHAIEELTSKKNELAFKHEGVLKLNKELEKTLKETIQRLNSYESMHQVQFKDRSEYLKKLEAQLNDYLLYNRSLGIKYRRIKYDLFTKNMNLINKIELKLNTFVSLKDKRQIKVLQERMHEALNEYFLLRIKYSQKNLWELVDQSNGVGVNIDIVNSNSKETLNQITEFLNNQTDYYDLRQQAVQKVYKEELIQQQKEIC